MPRTDTMIPAIINWLQTDSINIFGRPFAGKDTQGRKLAELLGAVLLGGGDILRNSVIPDQLKERMHAGELIPTKDFVDIVLPYLSQPAFAQKPLILSSVGRWQGEEESVLAATKAAGHSIRAVVLLELSEEAVRQRWQQAHHQDQRGQRVDDAAQALELRLKEFRDKTLPVLDFYHERGLLIEVDGNGSVELVESAILTKLYAKAQAD